MFPHSGPHNGKSGVSLKTITAAWHVAARLKYQCHYINYYKKYMSPLAGLQSIVYSGAFYSHVVVQKRGNRGAHTSGWTGVLLWLSSFGHMRTQRLRSDAQQNKPSRDRREEAVLARFDSNPGAWKKAAKHRPSVWTTWSRIFKPTRERGKHKASPQG